MNYSAFGCSWNVEIKFENFIILAHAPDMHAVLITLFTTTYGYQNDHNQFLSIFVTN